MDAWTDGDGALRSDIEQALAFFPERKGIESIAQEIGSSDPSACDRLLVHWFGPDSQLCDDYVEFLKDLSKIHPPEEGPVVLDCEYFSVRESIAGPFFITKRTDVAEDDFRPLVESAKSDHHRRLYEIWWGFVQAAR